jgi:hypothetical protein
LGNFQNVDFLLIRKERMWRCGSVGRRTEIATSHSGTCTSSMLISKKRTDRIT